MKSIVVFCTTILCGTASDLLSKWIVFGKFKESGYVKVIPGFAGIICSVNEGIAFGLFPSKGNALIYFTIFAIALIIRIYYQSEKSNTLNTIGLAIILSGAIGNLCDRIAFHSVRDFIDVHIGTYHWPTFNIADMLICIGVGIVVFRNIRMNREDTNL
ncbi:MAG: signal peptidase II [Candidatus Anammoxibacter sp.]